MKCSYPPNVRSSRISQAVPWAPVRYSAFDRSLRDRLARIAAATILIGVSACSKPRGENVDKASTCSPAAFDSLLNKYVHAGKVDYASLKVSKSDLESFNAYLERIGTCDVSGLNALARDAFWVNAYNAFNVKGVLDHWPVDNIKSIDGFLDKKLWRVANTDLTLNDIEYKRLIPARKDARNHFAVVCADQGSVPLESHAYTADEFEAALDKKARDFVADPNNFQVDIPGKRVRVSMLFSPEWYEKDFLADERFHGRKAVEYLIPYVDKETADFLASGDYAVSYVDWNWSLNGATSQK
jgi:hypothetical protein